VTGWHGCFAPAGSPQKIVDHLSTTLAGISRDPTVVKTLGNLGIDTVSSTPEELGQAIRADTALFKTALDAAGLLRQQTAR
jgi:tripartite-type tricarboxylate transporter receptor subunit TctC